MKKQQLQIVAGELAGFDSPDPSLEQYITPPAVAADVANRVALICGERLSVVDLGCGTGILSLCLGLLGFEVTGYDSDEAAIAIAEENMEYVEEMYEAVDVGFVRKDVLVEDVSADVVVMNPPFGIQQEGMNLSFLEKAFETAPLVFSLLHRSEEKMGETRSFIKKFASSHGFEASILQEYSFPLPATMSFHTEETREIGVDLYMFTNGDR